MSEISIKIDKTIKKHNMLQRGETVVIGVSGGADSMLLLSYFANMQKELDLRIIAANVEHGIRGSESVADSAFVEDFCKKASIEFHCLSIDAPALAKEAGMGVEEYSRKRRYEFFESFGADKIATAHNLSDNVETVLFRLSRGTSINGCSGIPYIRGKIIRPLLDLTSDEIRKECKERNIPFVVDSTNSDNNYSRNFIRNVIIPEFESLNPSFEKTFSRFIISADEDGEFIREEGRRCFESCISENGLDIEKLSGFHKSVALRAINELASQMGISLDEQHLSGVFELLSKRGRLQIKGSVYAISDLKTLRIDSVEEKAISFSFDEKIVDINDFLNNCELLKKEFDFYFDCDKIIGSFTIRQRAQGDKITPNKRNCTKSLKKLFNEMKIPADKRCEIPIVADDEGVIAVGGICIDERVCVDKATKKVTLLKITEDKN